MSNANKRPPYFIEMERAPKFTQMEGLEGPGAGGFCHPGRTALMSSKGVNSLEFHR
jgi:hypothetical protein